MCLTRIKVCRPHSSFVFKLALKVLSTSSLSGESTVSLDDRSHCTSKIFITVKMIRQFQIKKAGRYKYAICCCTRYCDTFG